VAAFNNEVVVVVAVVVVVVVVLLLLLLVVAAVVVVVVVVLLLLTLPLAAAAQSFLPSDLAAFQKMNALPNQPIAVTHGPATLPKGGTGEGDLDAEWLTGVAPTIPTTVWATAGQRYDPSSGKYDNEPFLTWLQNVSATPNDQIPNVFTISYQDYEDSLEHSFMSRVSDDFAALTVRGVTITTGSGDWGVGCADGIHSGALKAGMFRADFPSSSPYVLSVGATTFSGGQSSVKRGAEQGVTFSSGGFSNFFASPSYQSAAVQTYLKKHNVVPKNLFNASGRAFPDVSAAGVNFQYVINGKVGHVGGTSAASPAFAAVISLLNSARLAANKPTLGWVQPLLYRVASSSQLAFHDVTIGSNPHQAHKDLCRGFLKKSLLWIP